jgi:hypothetical protein
VKFEAGRGEEGKKDDTEDGKLSEGFERVGIIAKEI